MPDKEFLGRIEKLKKRRKQFRDPLDKRSEGRRVMDKLKEIGITKEEEPSPPDEKPQVEKPLEEKPQDTFVEKQPSDNVIEEELSREEPPPKEPIQEQGTPQDKRGSGKPKGVTNDLFFLKKTNIRKALRDSDIVKARNIREDYWPSVESKTKRDIIEKSFRNLALDKTTKSLRGRHVT